MPIYEYLCAACNRIYSFLTRSYDVDQQPVCPRCGATDLRRRMSKVAVVRGGATDARRGGREADRPAGGPPDPLDDPRLEREFLRLARDAEHLDENDPRQMGRFMRRMSEVTGEGLDEEMEEAVRRLEAGEDMERVEEDLGGVLGGGEEGFDDYDGGLGLGGYGDEAPSVDEGLYPL